MRFADFPFLRYLPFLLLGLAIGSRLHLSIILISILLALCWSGMSLLSIRKMGRGFVAIAAYFQLVLLGILCQSIHSAHRQPSDSVEGPFLAVALQEDVAKENSNQNLLEVLATFHDGQWREVGGKVLFYHQSEKGIRQGDVLVVHQKPPPVPAPQNPDEFDYRKYLEKKGIDFQQFSKSGFQVVTSTEQKDWFADLRHSLIELVRNKVHHSRAQQVALALLLGQKDFLDRDTKAAFSEAGVMHILAVSGLHVGILVAVLLFLVKPLRLKGKAKNYYHLGIVGCIWVFAALTGFSPSVARASVMFSLITLGQMKGRKPPVFNILAFSAMLMILLDPDVIFEVGFQLSYLAVAGIVLIQPLIVRWWLPPNKVSEYVWQLLAVSLAAQLVTFPLTLYYFHSFPTWFLIGNLIAIPLTFCVMNLGIPLLIFGWIPWVGDLLGVGVSLLLQLELWCLELLRNLPFGQVTGIGIQPVLMIVVWFFLLIWAAWDYVSKRILIYSGAIVFVIFVVVDLYRVRQSVRPELIVYQGQQGFAIDYWDGSGLKSWNAGIQPDEWSYKVEPHRIRRAWGTNAEALMSFSGSDQVVVFPEVGIVLDGDQLRFWNRVKVNISLWEEDSWGKSEFGRSISTDVTSKILF